MKNFSNVVSRRELIKGLGAIGVLSSLSAERLLAQTSIAPVRVLLVALQHGWGISGSSNRFMSGSESDFNFPTGLEPFEAIKDLSFIHIRRCRRPTLCKSR